MKAVSKVFIILGMIFLPLCAILLFTAKELLFDFLIQNIPDLTSTEIEFLERYFLVISIIMTVISVIALVVGSVSLYKLNTAKAKSELVAFGILTLLFVSLLGGIFMLCVKNEDLNAGRTISLNEISAPTQENPNQDQQ